jgi:Asp-tRNA(Asn)/Glu-tRNA(Gln) amidotransferase A subunit family amidase
MTRLPTTPDTAFITATEMLARSSAGALSAEDCARACLARVAARDPQVRAWVHLDPEQVILRARELDDAGLAGRIGPLHGLPVGVKDIILTHDMPTQYNSPLYRGFSPGIDAACVSLLRSAGALVFGKTDTVEFGATGRVAQTCNPHRLTHTPGGSSSGSAAAVADFHVPLALGTQTGGSIIRPASFCGIYGMKPTWNLVSREGAKMFSASLDTVGWFARSAADLGLLLDVFDPDPETAPRLPFELAGASIAVCRSPAWPLAEDATRHGLDVAVARLREAGAHVVDLDLPPAFEALAALHHLIMRAEGRSAFLADYRLHGDAMHQSFRDQVDNVDGFSRAQLCAAYDAAAGCRAVFDAMAGAYDAVLTPSTPGEAPAGLATTGSFAFNALWSVLQVPCVNVPGCVGPSGLPVGLTLTGPRFSDHRVLAVAAALGPLLQIENSIP